MKGDRAETARRSRLPPGCKPEFEFGGSDSGLISAYPQLPGAGRFGIYAFLRRPTGVATGAGVGAYAGSSSAGVAQNGHQQWGGAGRLNWIRSYVSRGDPNQGRRLRPLTATHKAPITSTARTALTYQGIVVSTGHLTRFER
jgi:hypothetical protein